MKKLSEFLADFTTEELEREIKRRMELAETRATQRWLEANNVKIGEYVLAKNCVGSVYKGKLTRVTSTYFYLENCNFIKTESARLKHIHIPNKYKYKIHSQASSLLLMYLFSDIDKELRNHVKVHLFCEGDYLALRKEKGTFQWPYYGSFQYLNTYYC